MPGSSPGVTEVELNVPSQMHTPDARPRNALDRFVTDPLLTFTDITAALLLAADLLVVCASVVLRSQFNAPVEWADDVARGLMVGSSFFGAASALKRGENVGVVFFIDRLSAGVRHRVDAIAALLVLIVSTLVAVNALKLGWFTTGQTTGSGLPLELTFYPMGAGAACMAVFAAEIFLSRGWRRVLRAAVILTAVSALVVAGGVQIPDAMPSSGTLMLLGFALTLAGGL